MKKILLLHNDQIVLKSVKLIFVSYGFDVRVHSSSLNVLEIVFNYTPDLILLDERLAEQIHAEIHKDLKHFYSTVPVMRFSVDKEVRGFLEIFGPNVLIRQSFGVKNLMNEFNICTN